MKKQDFKYQLKQKSISFCGVLDTILTNRGIEDINSFLSAEYQKSNLNEANLFLNIEKAKKLYLEHIENNSKIAILIDPDVDGLTSAALTYLITNIIIAAKGSDSTISYILPEGKNHKLDNKYNDVVESKCNLLITPDSSSNDIEACKLLKEKYKIDVLVLDHHEMSVYNNIATVVNCQDEHYPNKNLTGVGVAYKFLDYVTKEMNLPFFDINQYLDYVALGQIADDSDTRNLETRYLILQGLKLINSNKGKSELIKKLIEKEAYSLGKEVNMTGISFYIAPLLNSLIRNGSKDEINMVFKSLINTNETIITKIRGKGEVTITLHEESVRICDRLRRVQRKLTAEGADILNKQVEEFGFEKLPIMVLNGTEMNKNYTGLIANKIASLYKRPCLILREGVTQLTGSGRGFANSNIDDFKSWCNSIGIFDYAEGHPNAFGVSIDYANIDKLYSIVNALPPTDIVYRVDSVFNNKTINKAIIESIGKYKNIWGKEVEEPTFAIENITVPYDKIFLMGKNKSTLKFNYNGIEFIKFNFNEEEYIDMVKNKKTIEFVVVGKFSNNSYNGNSTPQVNIEDFKYKVVENKFFF